MKIGALHWFTSDLRVRDNPALAAGAARGPVAGVFVLDPGSLRRAADAPRRVAFMRACLASLSVVDIDVARGRALAAFADAVQRRSRARS